MKLVSIINGEPQVVRKSSEVKQLIIKQNLQYVVLGKFSYRKPDIHELRKVLSSQCDIKGEYSVGLIENSYVLIKLTI